MCEGCQNRYCMDHFVGHRQQLAEQMDQIIEDRDIIEGDLAETSKDHPLISHVDQWERKSVDMIHDVAEQARADIQQWAQQTKIKLNSSVERLTQELRARQEEDTYMEKDLERWIKQLQDFRQQLDKPSSISIVKDQKKPPLQLIKVKQNRELTSDITVSRPV